MENILIKELFRNSENYYTKSPSFGYTLPVTRQIQTTQITKKVVNNLKNEEDIEISGIKDKLCRSIAEKLETWIFKTSEQEFLEYYKGHSIVLGKMITFIENGESKEGCAVDIDENGGLVVKLSEGTGVPDSDEKSEALYKTLSSGEISVKVHM